MPRSPTCLPITGGIWTALPAIRTQLAVAAPRLGSSVYQILSTVPVSTPAQQPPSVDRGPVSPLTVSSRPASELCRRSPTLLNDQRHVGGHLALPTSENSAGRIVVKARVPETTRPGLPTRPGAFRPVSHEQTQRSAFSRTTSGPVWFSADSSRPHFQSRSLVGDVTLPLVMTEGSPRTIRAGAQECGILACWQVRMVLDRLAS
jgi:hypothetical protein